MAKLTIGHLAELTGVPAKTIRYYEETGLLPPAQRTESRYRTYSDIDVRRLELIRRVRLLEIPLPQVRQLVELASSASCDDFQGRLLEGIRHKMRDVERRITDLEALREDLTHLEAHLLNTTPDEGHPMLACSPDTCTCLGPQTLHVMKERR